MPPINPGRPVADADPRGAQRLTIRLQRFIGELKRRKVFQVTSFYLVSAWGLSAGAADIFDVLDFPAWASRYFVIALFSCTPLVVVFAWVFELSRSGIQRDRGVASSIGETVDERTVLAKQLDVPVLTAVWKGNTLRFTGEFVVGRDDGCGLQLTDPLVSRQHAKFEFYEGQWRVRDLGSANGIIVDGAKVTLAALLPESRVQFYPSGPELTVTIGHVNSEETRKI